MADNDTILQFSDGDRNLLSVPTPSYREDRDTNSDDNADDDSVVIVTVNTKTNPPGASKIARNTSPPPASSTSNVQNISVFSHCLKPAVDQDDENSDSEDDWILRLSSGLTNKRKITNAQYDHVTTAAGVAESSKRIKAEAAVATASGRVVPSNGDDQARSDDEQTAGGATTAAQTSYRRVGDLSGVSSRLFCLPIALGQPEQQPLCRHPCQSLSSTTPQQHGWQLWSASCDGSLYQSVSQDFLVLSKINITTLPHNHGIIRRAGNYIERCLCFAERQRFFSSKHYCAAAATTYQYPRLLDQGRTYPDIRAQYCLVFWKAAKDLVQHSYQRMSLDQMCGRITQLALEAEHPIRSPHEYCFRFWVKTAPGGTHATNKVNTIKDLLNRYQSHRILTKPEIYAPSTGDRAAVISSGTFGPQRTFYTIAEATLGALLDSLAPKVALFCEASAANCRQQQPLLHPTFEEEVLNLHDNWCPLSQLLPKIDEQLKVICPGRLTRSGEADNGVTHYLNPSTCNAEYQQFLKVASLGYIKIRHRKGLPLVQLTVPGYRKAQYIHHHPYPAPHGHYRTSALYQGQEPERFKGIVWRWIAKKVAEKHIPCIPCAINST